jgi:hypothetical protein
LKGLKPILRTDDPSSQHRDQNFQFQEDSHGPER